MEDVFVNATPRPAKMFGRDYNRASNAIFQNTHDVLTGAQTVEGALEEMEEDLIELAE